jgi:N-acetylglucosamine-6-phosphate deacetylase
VLLEPFAGIDSILDCYGEENVQDGEEKAVKLVTLAPELPGALDAIKEMRQIGIVSAIGHSTATYEQAMSALNAGARTITHLFNAMEPLHHRNPGIFGTLGVPSENKPFFGIITDGIHLHSSCVNIAWHSHPAGCILVTDAMFAAGLPDGIYDWMDGDQIEKKGQVLHLANSDGKIAGSAATMIECVNNFMNWTGASIAETLATVTSTPARMLGIEQTKGMLEPGADADILVLEDAVDDKGWKTLKVDQVWKFGKKVYEAEHI